MLLLWLIVGSIFLAYSYAVQDQTPAWYSLLGLTAVSAVAFVPDWPIWNRHPQVWLKTPVDEAGANSGSTPLPPAPAAQSKKKR
jgi:hypothetical protein